MNNFLKRNKAMVTFSGLIVMAIIIVTALIWLDVLSERRLKDNKETTSFLFEFAKINLLIAAATIAYIRFFKGHLFLSKIEYHIKHQLIELTGGSKLHFLNIEIENVGDYTVYNPIIFVNTTYLPSLLESSKHYIKDGKQKRNNKGKPVSHVLRAKASTSVTFELNVNDPNIIAVKFEVVIKIKKRMWKRILLVQN